MKCPNCYEPIEQMLYFNYNKVGIKSEFTPKVTGNVTYGNIQIYFNCPMCNKKIKAEFTLDKVYSNET
jgi:hypothetical protein